MGLPTWNYFKINNQILEFCVEKFKFQENENKLFEIGLEKNVFYMSVQNNAFFAHYFATNNSVLHLG